MVSASPTLSVIVAATQPGAPLRAVLESIWAQRWSAPNLIVVTRAATAEQAWLEAQRARCTRIVNAAEGSRFTALNAGLAHATGDWVLLLDATDRLVGEMMLSEALNWMKKTEAGVAAGEVAGDDGRIQKLRSHVNPLAGNFVPLSAAFYRRSLFEENGAFDPALPTQAHYDFNVRLWKGRVRFKPLPLRITATSARQPDRPVTWSQCREEIAVRHRYFSTARCAWWDFASLLRLMQRKLAR